MSDFHEQAVSDVASIDGDNYVNNLIKYAVSQRERVLELEAALREVMNECREEFETNGFSRCFELAEAALAEPEREKGK